jgi:CheY-like chemotaxis protein
MNRFIVEYNELSGWRKEMTKLVLIIDDEQELVEYLQEILESLELGIDVIVAYGGIEGIEKVEQNIDELDLVFIDMMMPDINGMAVYEKIRELSSDLKVIFMSGFPLAELSNDPFVFFLHKRFGLNDVENILEKISLIE